MSEAFSYRLRRIGVSHLGGGDDSMKPFARIRYVYNHTKTRLIPCRCKKCLFAERLGSGRAHFGLCKSTARRLDFTREESLEATALAIHDHYAMVAHELQQPLTMGFRGAT